MLSRLVVVPSGVNILSGLALAVVLAVACVTISFSTLGKAGIGAFAIAGALLVSGLFGLYTRQARFLSLIISAVTFLGLALFAGFLFIGAAETDLLKGDPGLALVDRAFGERFQQSITQRFTAAVDFGKCTIDTTPIPTCPESKTVQTLMKRWTASPKEFTGCPSGTQSLWCLGGVAFVSDVHSAFAIARFVAGGLAVSSLLIFVFALCSSKRSHDKAAYSRYGRSAV